MLNVSKGPAVHSLRAQADKMEYSKRMREVLENQEHLVIKQAEITEVLTENDKVIGVKTFHGTIYNTKAVILCTGTYLNVFVGNQLLIQAPMDCKLQII